jgi:hypothetical protein
MSRAQLSHVLLDVDFLHKPTVIGFRSEHGWNAIPWLLEMYCLMSRATNGRISDKIAIQTATDMGLKNIEAMIAYCIAEGLMLRENGQLTNSRVIQDQERLFKTRTDAIERKKKHVQNANGTRSSDTDTVTDTATDPDLEEKLNRIGWGPKPKAALYHWIAHRKAKNRPLGFSEIDAILMGWAHDAAGFCKAVYFHAQNGHLNLKEEERGAAATPKHGAVRPSQNVVNQMASDLAVKVFLGGES